MLMLGRHKGETIVLGLQELCRQLLAGEVLLSEINDVTIVVGDFNARKSVRLGLSAPLCLSILRGELAHRSLDALEGNDIEPA